MRDAFAVLLQGKSGSKVPKKPAVASKKRPRISGSNSSENGNTSNRNVSEVERSSSSFTSVACPVCGVFVALAQAGKHLDTGCSGPPTATDAHTEVQEKEPEPPMKQAKSSTVDVFGRMMSASSAASFSEEMWLIYHPEGGTFEYGWSALKFPLASPRGVWSNTMAVQGGGMCMLWTNLAPGTAPGEDCLAQKTISRFSVAQLKSLLQKNVRRGRCESAVRCAAELALKSWPDLIRRLSIISLEDSIAHPALPIITWLMAAAAKGYYPPPCMISAVLCIIYEIAGCPIQDSTEKMDTKDVKVEKKSKESAHETHEIVEKPNYLQSGVGETLEHCGVGETFEKELLNAKGLWNMVAGDSEKSLCRSLLLRMSYGGMKCDVSMMHDFCVLWKERFTGKCSNPPEKTYRKDASGVAPFTYLKLPSDICTAGTQLSSWFAYLVDIHAQCGMPPKLLDDVMSYIDPSKSKVPPSTRLIAERDAPACGIDFHVSNVLEDALQAPGMKTKLRETLQMLNTREHCKLTTATTTQIPAVEERFGKDPVNLQLGSSEERSRKDPVNLQLSDNKGEEYRYMIGELKTAMWKFSSSVNVRTPMYVHAHECMHESDCIDIDVESIRSKEVWNVICTEVDKCAMKIIRSRLARCGS